MADIVPWHARIFPLDGEVPVGAGVHVGGQKIITCAHVIEAALGLAAITMRPTGLVRIDFPQSTDRRVHLAQVIDDAWFPKRDGTGDLAVLQIVGEDVSLASPAPLRLIGSPARRTVKVLGHPIGQPNGVWARARLIGRGGPNIEWIQMDAPTLTGKRLQQGFSGAGVIDEEDGAVIGCVVAVDTATEDRIAWMIPTDIIAAYWPELRAMCRPAPAMRQPRPQVTNPFSGPEWNRLARLLHAHSSIRLREDRLLHINSLERQFDGRLHIERSDIDRSDGDFNATLAIVDACAAHPGALHSLAEQLARFQVSEDASVFPAINAAIEEVDPSPLLIPDERNRLYRLLNTVDPHVRADMVIRSYQEAVPPIGQSEIDPLDLPSVVRGLESATAVLSDLPPLIHFIEVLCHQLPAAKAADLHEWVDDFARREGIAHGQIVRLRLSTPPLLSPPNLEEAHKGKVEALYGDAQSTVSGPGGPDIVGGGGDPWDTDKSADWAEREKRFLEYRLPRNVRVASEFPLVVRITELQRATSSVPFLVPKIPDNGARLYVILDVPPGCEVVTDAIVPLNLPPHGDSDDAWFVVRAPETRGSYRITITVLWGYARSQVLAREPVIVQVSDRPTDPMETITRPTRSADPDHETTVLVVSRISARKYKYFLVRPGRSPVADDLRMSVDPRSRLRVLTSELNGMANGGQGWRPAACAMNFAQEEQTFGVTFFQARFGKRWARCAGEETLTVSCTNSTLAVPWELLYPIDPIGGYRDFLVQLFDVVRSPESTAAWCSRFVLRPAAIVLPDDQLPGTLEETRVIREMLDPGADDGCYIREKVQLQRKLRDEPFGLLHVAAHDRDGRGTISMAARQKFSPSDLNEFVSAGGQWSRRRPLAFINACGTASSRQTFTQFTSWAQRFFEAGAGGFIGSMWDVRSTTASIFAQKFYQEIYINGLPFSRALHEAREHSRCRDSDPTWLAYAAHGDHSARVSRST